MTAQELTAVEVASLNSELQLLKRAREAYYAGKPFLSDAEYDLREDLLREMTKALPEGERKLVEEFLNQTGAPAQSNWQKVAHQIPMRSLNKAKSLDELSTWYRNDVGGKAQLCLTEKLDGISVYARYEGGHFAQALTRGDGEIGEDITRNVRRMKGVPLQIDHSGELHLRGEIICRHSDFKAHFPNDSNPRNTASGTAKRTDGKGSEHLTVLFYQIVDATATGSKEEELKSLERLGFETPNWSLHDTLSSAEKVYQDYVSSEREALDYDIDGLVIEVSSFTLAQSLGEKNHRPKGGIAYKFPAESQITTLIDIEESVGNTGNITPVGIFEQVTLAGAKVKRASLHNYALIQQLVSRFPGRSSLAKGDQILVARRNDVIPYVESLIKPAQEEEVKASLMDLFTPAPPPKKVQEFSVPERCPECGERTQWNGKYLICPNTTGCPAQVSGLIKSWIKKVGILDWGNSLIDALVADGLVASIADLYRLQAPQVAAVQLSGRRVGDSTAQRVLDNLHAKKELPLHILVGSLGIPLCARSMCKVIIDAGFDSLNKMKAATVSDLEGIPKVGTTKAEAFVEGFCSKVPLLLELAQVGVKVKDTSSGKLAGKTFCFTGFRSSELGDAIEGEGGTMKSGVSKSLDVLVAQNPNSNSGKLKKARANGTTIVSVEEMWEMLA